METERNRRSLEELDAGQLEMMWSMLALGGCKPSVTDVRRMIDSADALRQAMIQKSGGHNRKDDPAYYIPYKDMRTHINLIVVSALALRVSGMLDKLMDVVAEAENGSFKTKLKGERR